MLRWAIAFFIVAIITAIFGFAGIATAAAGIAKILFFIFPGPFPCGTRWWFSKASLGGTDASTKDFRQYPRLTSARFLDLLPNDARERTVDLFSPRPSLSRCRQNVQDSILLYAASKTPFRKAGDSAEENFLPNSNASSMATLAGAVPARSS